MNTERWSFRGDLQSENIILLLHGYCQSGEQILDLLKKYLPEEWALASLSGSHKVELESSTGTVQGFAWYLYDIDKNIYITPLSEAVDYIVEQFNSLDISPKNLMILGYSQGGYMAPYVGQKLPQVSKVIGLNSRFRSQDLKGHDLNFSLVGIHGEKDQVIDIEKSRNCHQEIMDSGGTGEFVEVRRSGHKFDRALGKALRQQLLI